MFSIIKKYKRNLNNICKIREKGVSLISLIVTIIVLLILAGVTIRISSGDTGLIKRTKKSVAMYQNASEDESETLNEYAKQLKDFVDAPKATSIKFTADIVGWTTSDVTITATSDDPNYEIELKSEDSDWSVRKDNKITVSRNQQINARLKNLVDKYSEDVSTYNVTNIDKDAPDKTAPALKATTNSITVTFKQKDDGSGIAKREYSIDSGATWKAGDSVFTFSGLTQGKKYAIITRATDRVENQSISDVSYITTETIPSPVAESNLEFTPNPSGWTNGNVSVAVSTTVKGYTLQTSTDGKTWGTTNPLTYSANGTAYARLWDGNNASAVATRSITNIDKLAPTNTAPTVATTTNKITATLKQVDQNATNGSGKSDINASKTQYRLVTDTNGTTAVTGKDWQLSNVFSGLTQNTAYYVQTKVTDNAGNTTTSAVATTKTTSVPTPTTGANVIFTPSTSSWTNANVNVTVSTTITGFTLQTSTDGKTWGTTNQLTYSANGTAYARLWDGNNASAVATTNITNIDKLAPTNTAPTVATTTNKITATLKQVDQNAANSSGKSDLNASKTQYRLVTDTNGTTAVTGKDWQSSNVFSGLTQNTTYYVQTKVTDNAENTTTSAVATAKTTSIPTLTAGSNLTFTPTPSGWTNGNVNVTVSTTITGYTLQTSTDGKTWGTTNPLTYTANGTAYARLWDGNNASAVATTNITNIDKLAPTNTAPTVATTTNKITITNKQVDQNAGSGSEKSDLNASKTQYRLVTDTNGTTAVTGKDWQSSNVFSGLTQNTTYYVQTKVTDNAGNTTISAVATAKTTSVPTPTTGANVIFTPSTSSWTNGNVNVTVSTTITGFTLQTSTDGKTWGTTNPLIYSANGTVYARLWDGNNASAVATTNITNIDKLAPTNTAPTVATTTNKITITNKQVDQNAANGSGKSDLNSSKTQYRLVTDTNGTTEVTGKDWQSSNVFSGLTQNTAYYVQTKVTDNAGNTTTSAVATAKTTTVPSGTTSGVIILTPDHNTWTNTDVKVTATTNQTGYTIQMSTDGKTFTDGTSKTLTSNGTVYARLRDSSNNYGASASISISIIDKVAPTKPTYKAFYDDGKTTYTSGTWTNKHVKTDISSIDANSGINRIEYSFDKNSWNKIQFELSSGLHQNGTTYTGTESWGLNNRNDTVYFRAIDNAGNISEVFDSFNIRYDVTAPITTAPTTTNTTNSVTVTNKQTDNESEIASIQYQIKKNSDTTWGSLQSSATFGGLTQNTKYDVRTRAVDKAGNASYSGVTTVTTGTIPTPVRGSNVTFTPTPSGWTNGNVSVEVSTTVSGYTLQTSTNGSTWGTTNPLTYTTNGTAYARLWDGTNVSSAATLNVTNIDKLAPTNTAPTGSSKDNSITVTLKQTDATATSSYGNSGIKSSETRYAIKKTSSSTWGAWQASNSFTGLETGTSYDIKTKVTDNAGNSSESNVSTVTTSVIIDQNTPVGTKIGTTTVDGQKLDWYLFDTDTARGKAYLVSTPTFCVPDTSSVVNGAYTPKLVSSPVDGTYAMRQAIQVGSGTDSYSSSSVTYTPSANTLSYYKSVNSQWSAQRGNINFKSLNENEQVACYLADEDIFKGIKNQVNNANGALKGKIETLVGAPSVEQWCKAYNKQSVASSSQITCEYRDSEEDGDAPGYIYNVNGTAQNLGWYTNNKTIVGNDIYGAACTNNHTDTSKYPFTVFWWLASPSSSYSDSVCSVCGADSHLDSYCSDNNGFGFSLFASVSM